MRPIQFVVENLNRIALIKGEHMRLVGYEKSEDKQSSYLFLAPEGSKLRRIAQVSDDNYYRYADYLYVPFIAPTRKINRHLALNGAPIVKKPVVLKGNSLNVDDYYAALSEKFKGQLIQINTEDGFVVGVLNEIKKSDVDDQHVLSMNGINNKVYTVHEPILPFYVAKYNMSESTLNGILKEIDDD